MAKSRLEDITRAVEEARLSGLQGLGVGEEKRVAFDERNSSSASCFCNLRRGHGLRRECTKFYASLQNEVPVLRTCPVGFEVACSTIQVSDAAPVIVALHVKIPRPSTMTATLAQGLPRQEKKELRVTLAALNAWDNPNASQALDHVNRVGARARDFAQDREDRALNLAITEYKDFVASFSHEALNPIQEIRSRLERAETRLRTVDAESHRLVSEASMALDRLRISIEGIRLLFNPNIVPLGNRFLRKDVFKTMQHWFDIYREQTSNRGIDIFYSPTTGPWYLYVVPEAFELLARNIISNAVKYSFDTSRGPNGKIVVGFNEKTGEISVVNFGVPIPAEEIDSRRIFDLSRRGTTSGDRDREGKGVGLYLVSLVAKMHNAVVEVTSVIQNPHSKNIFARNEFKVRFPLERPTS